MSKNYEKDAVRNPVSVSAADYHEYSESMSGLCIECREWTHDSAEPDARHYECPVCGNHTVYGADEALLMGFIVCDDENE